MLHSHCNSYHYSNETSRLFIVDINFSARDLEGKGWDVAEPGSERILQRHDAMMSERDSP